MKVRIRKVAFSTERHAIVARLLPTDRRPATTNCVLPLMFAGGKRAVVRFGRLPILTENPSRLLRRAKPWRDDRSEWARIGRDRYHRMLLEVVLDHFPEARFATCRARTGTVGPDVGDFATAWVCETLVAVFAPVMR